MKFLRITNACVNYSDYFYARRPELLNAPFEVQKEQVDYDHLAWGTAYVDALAKLGYQTEQFVADILPLQRAWAAEHGLPDAMRAPGERIVFEQIRQFQPDILQFEMNDGALLREIRASFPSIKLVIGWEGSALSTGKTWADTDLMLSCAPEAVDKLRKLGVRADHLHHAFNPELRNRLKSTSEQIPMSFVGNVIRRNQFHVERDRILSQVANRIAMRIYAPSVSVGWKEYAKVVAAGVAYAGVGVMRCAGMHEAPKASPFLSRVYRVASRPRLPVNPRLRRLLRPAVFGLEYYQVMRDSAITLNIHADSSPTHASNIRLFEATGAESCLLTDYRDNLASLFEPDSEVVTYRTAEECLEKAQWLLNHPSEREAIAKRGARRTYRDHTFTHRAQQLDGMLHEALKGTGQACVTYSH